MAAVVATQMKTAPMSGAIKPQADGFTIKASMKNVEVSTRTCSAVTGGSTACSIVIDSIVQTHSNTCNKYKAITYSISSVHHKLNCN